MSNSKNIEVKLDNIMGEIKEIIDEVIEIRKDSVQNKAETTKILEAFLTDLYQYFKTASKSSGDNLLAGINLMKIKLMTK